MAKPAFITFWTATVLSPCEAGVFASLTLLIRVAGIWGSRGSGIGALVWRGWIIGLWSCRGRRAAL